ncbi:MAG: PadR family transcriptional regulator [Gammaproteobacteria bacterium]|nr:PadR family transcriptional regulator [Gammaproteobacteria bacterium]NNL44898.1 PadR family transcriptional regulator [Woeseiaceae bacterium]
MRKLGELEGVALGIVLKRQPCTAYAVRIELKASPSSHWRASAGAIYPLLSRLEHEGLIQATNDNSDGRGRRHLSITREGKKALKAWIKAIANPDRLSEIFDPLRSRMFFLGALGHQEQIALAESVLEALDLNLENSQQYVRQNPASGDFFEHLGAIGGVMNAESRIKFLREALTQIRRHKT